MVFRRMSRLAAAAALVVSLAAVSAAPEALAQAKAPPKPAAPSIAPDTAKKFITDMGNRTVSVLANQSNAQARNDAFTAVMLDAIDFDSLAMQTLGKMSRTVTPTDRREFTELFAAYVIDVAVQKFGTTQVSNFSIGALKDQPNGDIKVNTVVNT
ncbi:MAG: ABC transporter substrate-binding protein, partial [Alphaproteobacteria bacterium]|nr:ABC transporter substrate-binding protein [Alphaproteobacteria bacterium]